MTRRGQYALTEHKTAPLYSEFARPFLERHFAPAVVAALYDKIGTYSRGPRKGMTRGYVHWTKCMTGGWYRPHDGSNYGRVIRPGSHNVRVHLTRDNMTGC